MTSSRTDEYTFGDDELAAERLRLLADVFAPALAELVRRHASSSAEHVLDLGCGPGYTTRTLWALLSPRRLTGLDCSASFLERARRSSPEPIEYRLQDVTTAPFGLPLADFAYARFLLAHLAAPQAVLGAVATALRPGGRLLLQETAELASEQPCLARYYELVRELQRLHGQRLHIGRELLDLFDRGAYRVIHHGVRSLRLPVSQMARLHELNLSAWRRDPLAGGFDAAELDRLGSELGALAESEPANADLRYAMAELVLERLP